MRGTHWCRCGPARDPDTPDAHDVAAIEAEADRMESRAKLLDIAPLDPTRHPNAAAALQAEREAIELAGAADDVEDQRAAFAAVADGSVQ